MSHPSPPDRHHSTAISMLTEESDSVRLFRLRVTGESMVPLLRTGDHIIAQRVPGASLRLGDLVVIRLDAALVTHRLIANGVVDGWYTKGDNSLSVDPPVPAAEILGRVVAIECQGRRLDATGMRWTTLTRGLGHIGRWQAAFLEASRSLGARRRLAGQVNGSNRWAGLYRSLAWSVLRFTSRSFRALTRLLGRLTRQMLMRPVSPI